jgi:hypothetical protein
MIGIVELKDATWTQRGARRIFSPLLPVSHFSVTRSICKEVSCECKSSFKLSTGSGILERKDLILLADLRGGMKEKKVRSYSCAFAEIMP